jgi:hypothetical protein
MVSLLIISQFKNNQSKNPKKQQQQQKLQR